MDKKRTVQVLDQSQVDGSDTIPALSEAEVFAVVGDLLGSTGVLTTKAENGAEPLRLPKHARLREDRVRDRLRQMEDQHKLRALERELLVQIDRIESVERAFQFADQAGGGRERLHQFLVEADSAADKAIVDVMSDVKQEDRPLEEAVRSYDAEIQEARLDAHPQAREQFYILNADPRDLPSHESFGKAPHLGPLDGIGIVRKNHYGLIATDSALRDADAAANLGFIGGAHSAVIVDAVDMSDIDPAKRRDSLGEKARAGSEKRIDAKMHAITKQTPLDADDLAILFETTGDQEGLERVVQTFGKIKVRKASRYEQDLGDVLISASYPYTGKLAYLGMVSREHSLVDLPSSPRKANALRGYAVSSGKDNPGDDGPLVISLETVRDLVSAPVVIAVRADVLGDNPDPITYLEGIHVSRGKHPNYQIGVVLAKEYLRRILYVWGRCQFGEHLARRGYLRREITAILHRELVGSVEDPTKPFLALEIEDDTDSTEGQQVVEAGGIRFVVKVTPKTGIEQTQFVILTKQGTGLGGKVTGDEE